MCVCAPVCRVFRLSNPPCCVFMHSQANCVIKAMINVMVYILYVVVCVFCCADSDGREAGVAVKSFIPG